MRFVSAITILYLVIFLTFYSLLPTLLLTELYGRFVSILSYITVLSCVIFAISCYFPFPKLIVPKLVLPYNEVALFSFGIFIFFIGITFVTAQKIPIIESLKGASPEQLAYYREMFLKARSGWQQSLGYINGILTGAVLPYLICLGFERKSKFRHIFLAIFFCYCISFLEKSYFIKIGLPVAYILYFSAKNKKRYLLVAFSIVFSLLLLMTVLAGGNFSPGENDTFFSVAYEPAGPIEKIVWRSIVIPVVTAADGIRVFYESFGGKYFHGATSSLLAFVSNVPRINYERELFSAQWGQNETETGNANGVYLLEAFINFGYIGVILFSFLAGRIIRVFSLSPIRSLQALAPLFIFNIYNAGLIGTMLSNGYLLMIVIALFVKFKE